MEKLWQYLKGVGIPVVLLLGAGAGYYLGFTSISKPIVPPPTFEEQVHQLEVESRRGTEYFNSPTYESLTPDSLTAIDSSNADKLRVRLKEPSRQYLLSLLALRKLSPNLYDIVGDTLKAGILVDALNQATYFNAWGIPHRYWSTQDNSVAAPDSQVEDPALALIQLGRPDSNTVSNTVIEALRPLLTEERQAPLWGAHEGWEGRETYDYPYRVADYALALNLRIQGGIFPKSRAARDSLIQIILGQPTSTQ